MRVEEAKKIAEIGAHVDGGCPTCVAGVVWRLDAAFPDFDWPDLFADAGAIDDLATLREDLAKAREDT